MKHVVMFSGGIGSWATAKRVAERYGTDDLYLVFSDVGRKTDPNPHAGEDEDTYRFLKDAAANVGGTLVWLQDGRDIWGVFRDDRFLGNTRHTACSNQLKQVPAKRLETQEQEMREFLGKDVSILRDRTGGTLKPLTLTVLRQRIQGTAVGEVDADDIGGCGCFLDEE